MWTAAKRNLRVKLRLLLFHNNSTNFHAKHRLLAWSVRFAVTIVTHTLMAINSRRIFSKKLQRIEKIFQSEWQNSRIINRLESFQWNVTQWIHKWISMDLYNKWALNNGQLKKDDYRFTGKNCKSLKDIRIKSWMQLKLNWSNQSCTTGWNLDIIIWCRIAWRISCMILDFVQLYTLQTFWPDIQSSVQLTWFRRNQPMLDHMTFILRNTSNWAHSSHKTRIRKLSSERR